MNPPLCILLATVFFATTTAYAQNGAASAARDADWARVVTMPPPPPANAGATPSQVTATAVQRARQFKEAAQAARNFIISYPTDSRVPQAKKLEARSAVLGVHLTDQDKGQPAIQIAAAFRADKSNSLEDRFDVALLIERKQYEMRTAGRPLAGDALEHERVAKRLYDEFRPLPAVFGFYLGVADTSDVAVARRAAQSIIALPAPQRVRREAQTIIDRCNLIGRAVNFQCNTLDGRPVDLNRQNGQLSVVVVWSAQVSPHGLRGLNALKGRVPRDTQWVFVSLGGTATQLTAAKSQAPFPGLHCVDPRGFGGPVAEALKVRQYPYCYVINRDRTVAGFGLIDELPKILGEAALR